MLQKLNDIEKRFESIEEQLMDPSINTRPSELQRLGKARAELDELVGAIRNYKKTLKDLEETQELLEDPEMKEMAQEELPGLKTLAESLENDLKAMLIPKDPNDGKPIIVEIRPAAGGDEAGLFASEIFRMYTRYCERNRWKYEVLDHEETGLGSLSRVVFTITAPGAYGLLKFESGVHRVQRVPATESGGRIHTSTITVAIMPEVEEAEIDIKAEDIEVSTFCSSSAGGQHMQKNETAIRIIHKASGIVVTCQDERSQAQNKLKAMAVLRAKVFQAEQERLDLERGALRKGQIGSGDRSEKIRTYNFPQSRITDHRIGFNAHNMIAFMDGDMQGMLDALVQDDIARRMAEESAA